ncbi:MAG: TolC family protein [Flavobacteriales bacterium]|nr:TolC family protein [Flavobacteriales bacterium]
MNTDLDNTLNNARHREGGTTEAISKSNVIARNEAICFGYDRILRGIASFLAMTLFVTLSTNSQAQDVLSRDEAMKLALEHNYDIQVAQKTVETAENNASIYNSGYLPTASASGAGNVTYNAGQNETVQGTNKYSATDAYSYNASLGINYTIFNGLGRMYNYKQLKEQHSLSELQAKQIIENTILQLSSAYFEIARLTETVEVLKNTLSISKQRLKRSNYSYDYGQSTQLDVLNSEVDVNNDSINLLNTQQQLENAKRNLNLIMGRTLENDFNVDTNVTFALAFTSEELIAKALERNVQIEQTQSQLRNSEFAIKASRAGWFPSLSANAAYAYQGQKNPNGAFLTGSTSYGPQAGLSLSWNIFDGGTTKTRQQNAKIALESQKIQQERTTASVQRDVLNAYSTYQNALFVLKAQSGNLATTKRNFERSNEMYKQGQITSIEFRQAQLNLLNAESNLSQAKYNAKNAELQLKQLAGVLLEE